MSDKKHSDMHPNPHGKATKGDMAYLGKSGAAEDIRARTIAESNLAIAWEIRQLRELLSYYPGKPVADTGSSQ